MKTRWPVFRGSLKKLKAFAATRPFTTVPGEIGAAVADEILVANTTTSGRRLMMKARGLEIPKRPMTRLSLIPGDALDAMLTTNLLGSISPSGPRLDWAVIPGREK